MKSVIGYTRVSTDGQVGEDKFGLEEQKNQILDYCARNDMEVVRWFTDEGESGAKEIGIDEAHCELMPADKVSHVERLIGERRKNGTLAFVGDGINDAPVLARADLGIAMGALGSDAAIEAADIVLMNDKPSSIATAIAISRKTHRIVNENIAFALIVKAIVLVLSALGKTTMWAAVFADVGVSVLAILNAMRALREVK